MPSHSSHYSSVKQKLDKNQILSKNSKCARHNNGRGQGSSLSRGSAEAAKQKKGEELVGKRHDGFDS
jgi:hypothetical protein